MRNKIIIGIIALIVTGAVAYILVPEEIKNPKGYLEKQMKIQEERRIETEKYKDETNLLKKTFDEMNVGQKDSRYEDISKVEVGELEKAIKDIQSLDAKLTTADKEYDQIKKEREAVLQKYNEVKQTIEAKADETVKRQKELLEKKVKAEEERKALVERSKKAHENSGFNIPQKEDNLELTVLAKDYFYKDDKGDNPQFNSTFQKITFKVKNIGTEPKTITGKMFLAKYGWSYEQTHATAYFKDSLKTETLQPNEEKTMSVAFETLDPKKYNSYDIEDFIYIGNGPTSQFDDNFLPIMKFKVK